VQLDLSETGRPHPFLQGRALFLAACLADGMPPAYVPPFVAAAAAALQPACPAPLRICACRTLTQLAPKLPLATLQAHLPPIYGVQRDNKLLPVFRSVLSRLREPCTKERPQHAANHTADMPRLDRSRARTHARMNARTQAG
jgi:hypothetical protein